VIVDLGRVRQTADLQPSSAIVLDAVGQPR
jgi:hypothetical protein